MYTGKCLCEKIQYQVSGDIQDHDGNLPLPTYCHCKMCQRLSGSAFTVATMVKNEQFKWLCGEEHLKRYESSPNTYRSFCSNCGSSLAFESDEEQGLIYLNIGAINETANLKPRSHIFVADKAPWHDINDNLPQFSAYPED